MRSCLNKSYYISICDIFYMLKSFNQIILETLIMPNEHSLTNLRMDENSYEFHFMKPLQNFIFVTSHKFISPYNCFKLILLGVNMIVMNRSFSLDVNFEE